MDQLFKGSSATMFANNEQFTIHPLDQPCSLANITTSSSLNDTANSEESIGDQVQNFVINTYPKNKFLPLVFKNLVKHNLIDSDLFFIDFPTIHLADFCAFINNSFGNKKTKSNSLLLKLCRFIRTKHIKFPVICIKNPVARQALV